MRLLGSRRPGPRRLTVGAGLLAGAGAVAASAGQRRHRLALASDPLWEAFSNPLAGSVLAVVSADGTEQHVRVYGDGSPLVVLAPGWTEELQMYDLLTERLLEAGCGVAAFDLRGQGLSGVPVGWDQKLERYGEDVEAVLVAVASGRTDVLLVGHSMGAMSIAAWASLFDVPARVAGVGLLNTGLDGLVAAARVLPDLVPGRLAAWLATSVFLGSSIPVAHLSTPLSRAITRRIAFGPGATDAMVEASERMLWRCAGRARAGAGRSLASLDLLDAASSLTVPVLVVAGEVDRLTPVSHARRIAAALPSLSELLVLPATGHMSPLERPAELCDALMRLAAVAVPGR